MTKTGRRPNHIIGGLLIFAIGLFIGLMNILYVVEFIKGGLQPLFIIIGLAAATAAIFHSQKSIRPLNIVVAVLFIFLGAFGVYDEYFATMDFLNGILPLALIFGGLASLIHGIKRLM
jgi:hypothetical protein